MIRMMLYGVAIQIIGALILKGVYDAPAWACYIMPMIISIQYMQTLFILTEMGVDVHKARGDGK